MGRIVATVATHCSSAAAPAASSGAGAHSGKGSTKSARVGRAGRWLPEVSLLSWSPSAASGFGSCSYASGSCALRTTGQEASRPTALPDLTGRTLLSVLGQLSSMGSHPGGSCDGTCPGNWDFAKAHLCRAGRCPSPLQESFIRKCCAGRHSMPTSLIFHRCGA